MEDRLGCGAAEWGNQQVAGKENFKSIMWTA